MDRALKQRLLGAVILTALLVILVPEWLDGAGHRARYSKTIEIPETPNFRPMSELMSKPEPVKSASGVAEQQTKQSSIHAWALQVGSFNEQENAQSLRDQLRANGYPAYIDELKAPDATSYRVRIGPELDRSRIDKLKDTIADKEKIDGMVVKHP